jgi:hypothetical protein
MGVATGGAVITTQVTIPSDIELGESNLVVVANGIPSDPVSVLITERDGRHRGADRELSAAGQTSGGQ